MSYQEGAFLLESEHISGCYIECDTPVEVVVFSVVVSSASNNK